MELRCGIVIEHVMYRGQLMKGMFKDFGWDQGNFCGRDAGTVDGLY